MMPQDKDRDQKKEKRDRHWWLTIGKVGPGGPTFDFRRKREQEPQEQAQPKGGEFFAPLYPPQAPNFADTLAGDVGQQGLLPPEGAMDFPGFAPNAAPAAQATQPEMFGQLYRSLFAQGYPEAQAQDMAYRMLARRNRGGTAF
jgi:hypothetical protein